MEDSVGEPYNVRAITMTGCKQNEDQSARSQYSMPGILHFLQTEWTRYEADRIQWDVDRAELQVFVTCFRPDYLSLFTLLMQQDVPIRIIQEARRLLLTTSNL